MVKLRKFINRIRQWIFQKINPSNISSQITTKKLFTKDPTPPGVWTNPLYFVAFGFGVGAIPIAPGTFGTLIAIPLFLALNTFSLTIYIIATLLFTILSIFIADKVSKEIGVHDHQGMCIDEVVGFLITMIAAPKGWLWIMVGFILFRFFDIVKPWPIHLLDEKLSGGFGVILDDVVAGLFSLIILQLLHFII